MSSIRFKNLRNMLVSEYSVIWPPSALDSVTVRYINRQLRFGQRSSNIKCSLDHANREQSFYRSANGRRIASEEVVLHLITSKCLPVFLCGLGLFIEQIRSAVT